jgi:ribosomal protein L37AE/L43A
MNSSTPLACPICHQPNTTKCVDSLLTEIHICRDCRQTFVVYKPSKEPVRPAPE